MATCLLPINSNTIVWGSNDGGGNVHTSALKVNAAMEQLGQHLNLAEHLVGRQRTSIVGPGDLEIHYGVNML